MAVSSFAKEAITPCTSDRRADDPAVVLLLTGDPKQFEIHLSQMKRFAALATILVASPCFAQAARDYYNEIYAAGGLDRGAARYVCFNEDLAVKTFFVFTENKVLREYMISNGKFDKLSKAERAELSKDYLIFRGYDKGVPLATNDFLFPDGTGVDPTGKTTR
jgi:hypothetical protein